MAETVIYLSIRLSNGLPGAKESIKTVSVSLQRVSSWTISTRCKQYCAKTSSTAPGLKPCRGLQPARQIYCCPGSLAWPKHTPGHRPFFWRSSWSDAAPGRAAHPWQGHQGAAEMVKVGGTRALIRSISD